MLIRKLDRDMDGVLRFNEFREEIVPRRSYVCK